MGGTSGWSNQAPNNTRKAIINANYDTVANGSITACECQVNSGVTLTVKPNTYLLVESNIENNGTIIVEHKGSVVQHNSTADNTGIGTYTTKKANNSI